MGFLDKVKTGLKKTRENIIGKFDAVVKSFTKIDEDLFEELQESLIMGDVGVGTSQKICNILKNKVKSEGISDPTKVKGLLEQTVSELLKGDDSFHVNTKPCIILVIGVNGVGKTTTIGKLAYNLEQEGKNVLLCAADTFRAAAIDQLEIWAERAGCSIVKQSEGSDPAAVVFDSISAAKSRDVDVIICDTAGRLHNRTNLMKELEKISRIINRELPQADMETLLVLDASTGQNAVNQAKEFNNIIKITGIVLTKLDGTAKGGIILAIKDQLGIPVKFIGVGEGIDDLQPFKSNEFAQALFDEGDRQ